jgi:glycosyltransferase involved in cell wall biosynthesis/dTDP-4-dehydrorhamnose 3,5-epimerase-like enzyme
MSRVDLKTGTHIEASWPVTIPWRQTPSPFLRSPQVSIAIPCYNEEACIGQTAPALVEAFQNAGIVLELVLVDNGSSDRTGAIIDDLIDRGLPVRKVRFEVNEGYAAGIIAGLEACTAPVIGFTHADGQVAPNDVVTAYRLMEHREERVLAKVRRRFRQDSWKRKVVSIIYNGMMQVVFGWLGVIDINGSPKFFSRRNFQAMGLVSRDWFLDPEIVLKAKALGLRAIEIDVEGHARNGGVSHVKRETMLEFLKNIYRYRFGGYYRNWKREESRKKRSWAAISDSTIYDRADAAGAAGGLQANSACIWADVRVFEQRRFEDGRGYLQKVFAASQCGGDTPRGEVYVTAAKPGEAKGNHFHRRMGELFSVVEGNGSIELCDPRTGERRSIALSPAMPVTVYVPPGLAHAVVNCGQGMMICVAWAEREHDPEDVFPFDVWPAYAQRRSNGI